jgi:hypothetical protein
MHNDTGLTQRNLEARGFCGFLPLPPGAAAEPR